MFKVDAFSPHLWYNQTLSMFWLKGLNHKTCDSIKIFLNITPAGSWKKEQFYFPSKLMKIFWASFPSAIKQGIWSPAVEINHSSGSNEQPSYEPVNNLIHKRQGATEINTQIPALECSIGFRSGSLDSCGICVIWFSCSSNQWMTIHAPQMTALSSW